MALATFVKISTVNNLSDARYCAGMEVDQMGFSMVKGDQNYVSPEDFKELTDWLSGVEFVGEVSSYDIDLNELIKTYALSAIEVGSLDQITEAAATGLKVIFRTNQLTEVQEALSSHADILDFVLIEDVDLTELKKLDSLEKVVIGSGFDANNVSELIDTLEFKGISLKGGDEIRPGYKNFDELADILETLDTDEFV